MKKNLVLFLATCLCLCITSFVLAEDTEGQIQLDQNTMSGNTTVSLTVDNSSDNFTVVIPSSITIDQGTQYGYGQIVLKKNWELSSYNGLSVWLDSAENGIGNTALYSGSITNCKNLTLKSQEGVAVTYGMTIGSRIVTTGGSNNSSYLTIAQDYIIHVKKGDANTQDITKEIVCYVGTMPSAGVYTDTLTFTITTN